MKKIFCCVLFMMLCIIGCTKQSANVSEEYRDNKEIVDSEDIVGNKNATGSDKGYTGEEIGNSDVIDEINDENNIVDKEDAGVAIPEDSKDKKTTNEKNFENLVEAPEKSSDVDL